MFRLFLYVIVALAIGMLIVAGLKFLWNLLMPTKQLHAVVSRKQSRPLLPDIPGFSYLVYGVLNILGKRPVLRGSTSNSGNFGGDVGFSQLIVTFSFDDRTRDFVVDEETYVRVAEGEPGLLIHKGEKFLRFVPLRVDAGGNS